MDLEKLADACRKREGIQIISLSPDMLTVSVRQKISDYDEDLASWIAENPHASADVKAVLPHLREIDKELVMRFSRDWFEVMCNKPDDAFGNPFMDIGYYEILIHEAFYHTGDIERIVETMLCFASSFRLDDTTLLCHLAAWWKRRHPSQISQTP